MAKLRNNQRTAQADFAVIVSRALLKEVDYFDLVDVMSPARTRTGNRTLALSCHR